MCEKANGLWAEDSGEFAFNDVKTICYILATGGSKKSAIEEPADLAGYVVQFWKLVTKQPFVGRFGARGATILQQPVVLKALAKLLYDLEYGVPKIRNYLGLKKVHILIHFGVPFF